MLRVFFFPLLDSYPNLLASLLLLLLLPLPPIDDRDRPYVIVIMNIIIILFVSKDEATNVKECAQLREERPHMDGVLFLYVH